jgi:hypothetical protein
LLLTITRVRVVERFRSTVAGKVLTASGLAD